MTALLYRGHTYEAAPSAPKVCVELTYRREHYNTCRQELLAAGVVVLAPVGQLNADLGC